jgi:hypothetical protein
MPSIIENYFVLQNVQFSGLCAWALHLLSPFWIGYYQIYWNTRPKKQSVMQRKRNSEYWSWADPEDMNKVVWCNDPKVHDIYLHYTDVSPTTLTYGMMVFFFTWCASHLGYCNLPMLAENRLLLNISYE